MSTNNNNPPNHIAIIMDGNSRWAKNRLITQNLGYKKGIIAAQNIIRHAKNIGVKYLTLFAFSSENWNRPEKDVKEIMDMLRKYLKKDIEELLHEDIKIIFIGSRKRLDPDIAELMHQVEERSKNNSFNLIMAMSYGSRNEILDAAIEFSKKIDSHPQKSALDTFTSTINPHNIPDPDLLIRTSGEYRLSNFLLWQIAYTELYFTDKLWPDFTTKDLDDAINNYNSRERRYGR